MGVGKHPCKDMARRGRYLPFGSSCQKKDLTPIYILLKVGIWETEQKSNPGQRGGLAGRAQDPSEYFCACFCGQSYCHLRKMISHPPWGMACSASEGKKWVITNYSQKAGGSIAVKYYHSAQVQPLCWCSWLHRSPVTKALFSFEYTEQQELGYCASKFLLEAAWAQQGFRLPAHPVCLCRWVSLQERPWAAETEGRFGGCQESTPQTETIHMEVQLSLEHTPSCWVPRRFTSWITQS